MSEAGWQPDPFGRHELRWWDGAAWTEHVSDHGVASVDPPVAPAAPVAPVAAPLPPPSFAPPASVPPVAGVPYAAPVGGPPSGPQPVVPVQSAPPPEGSGGRGLWIAVVLAVLLVGAGVAVFLGLRNGDDESASDGTEETIDDTVDDTVGDTITTTEATPPTSVVETTVAPTAAPTTVAETTVPPTEGPTTAPPTVPTVVTPEVLVAALPTAAEVPPGFTASGDAPDTTPAPDASPGAGLCGGPNTDARAQAAGLVARAWSGRFTAQAGYLVVGVFAFPTPEAASAFMASTVQQAALCGPGLTYQKSEAEWDIFSDVADATWNVTEYGGAAPATAAGADEAFQLTTQFVSTTRLDGVDYSSSDGDVIQYERFGRAVVLVDRWGSWDPKGFGNIDPTTSYQPTGADVAAIADVVRSAVVGRLTATGVV